MLSTCKIPGSSFGWKKCRTSIRPNFPPDSEKKNRRPEKHPDPKFRKTEMIKGWIIHKQTAFAPRVFFSGAHSIHNPTLEPSRSHCPRPSSEWPKTRTITKWKQLVPKQRLPRRNQGACGKEPFFLCNRVSKVVCYKVGCSPRFFKACLRKAPERK